VTYRLDRHRIISSALKNFNSEFLSENDIIFGGGTRIALEINEYRESVDIDFLCPNKNSYRSIREQVSNKSLGSLVKKDFEYIREIRPDKYGVRTVIKHENLKIKLEFISFDDYKLTWLSDKSVFPVPYLDYISCYYTKLLANSDRKLEFPYKDIFDLLAMRKEWGVIPKDAINLASDHYSKRVVIKSLIKALEHIQFRTEDYLICANGLNIDQGYASILINTYVPILLAESKAETW
jgi:hypothetical protein